MKIAVFGAGAIGGFLAARLLEAGQDVSLIARGPHLAALRQSGLDIRSAVFGNSRYRPPVTDQPEELGQADLVILTVKAHALAAAARSLPPLLGPATAILTVQNGIPWWYFHGIDHPNQPGHLESADPGGEIVRRIDAARVVAGLAYIAAGVPSPGIVEHI